MGQAKCVHLRQHKVKCTLTPFGQTRAVSFAVSSNYKYNVAYIHFRHTRSYRKISAQLALSWSMGHCVTLLSDKPPIHPPTGQLGFVTYNIEN